MKKRLLSLLLAALMLAACLSGCSSDDDECVHPHHTLQPGDYEMPTPGAETEASADTSDLKLHGYSEEEFHDDDFGWEFDTEGVDVVWGDLYTTEDREAGWAFTVPVFAPGDSLGEGLWDGMRLSSYGDGLFTSGDISDRSAQDYESSTVEAVHGQAFDFSDSIDKENTVDWEKKLSDFEMEVTVAVRTEEPEQLDRRTPLYWANYPGAKVRAIQVAEHEDVKVGWFYGGYVSESDFGDDDWIGYYIFQMSRRIDDGHWLSLTVSGDWGSSYGLYFPANLTEDQQAELWSVFQSTCQKLARFYGMGDAADILPSTPIASYDADNPDACVYTWLTDMIEEDRIG